MLYPFRTDLPFNQPDKLCDLAEPHSNAYIDLNGDCLPGMRHDRLLAPPLICFRIDIFLVCREFGGLGARSFQIWTNNKTEGYDFAGEWDLPDGAGAISFADMGK